LTAKKFSGLLIRHRLSENHHAHRTGTLPDLRFRHRAFDPDAGADRHAGHRQCAEARHCDLVYLGVREWRNVFRAQPEDMEMLPPDAKPKGVFWHGFVVAITNPKTVFFFVAFFPQFIDPERAYAPQIITLCVTFMVLAFLLDGMYAVLAGRARHWLVGAGKAKLRHGITGTLLLGTGIGLALARRS
jgi:hypothetical protein